MNNENGLRSQELNEVVVEHYALHLTAQTGIIIHLNSLSSASLIQRPQKMRKEINLMKTGSFVQKFITNPLMVDGRKFDIGIYSVLTSILPLRVYVMDSDALFRYCSKIYHPFNAEDTDRYIVGEDYTPTWEIPSLRGYYNKLAYNNKMAFNAYMTARGYAVDGIWREMYDTVREVYREKESDLVMAAKGYSTTRNFFEMVRFDFVVDADLKVYLMEVNMSPNLSTSHIKRNRLLYEQVLNNVFSLVGVARSSMKNYDSSNDEEKEMFVGEHDITTFPDFCVAEECNMEPFACENVECKLCHPCLQQTDREIFKAAYLEHLHRMNMRRVLPEPVNRSVALVNPRPAPVANDRNQLMFEWFRGKCLLDNTWCE